MCVKAIGSVCVCFIRRGNTIHMLEGYISVCICEQICNLKVCKILKQNKVYYAEEMKIMLLDI